MAGYDPLEFGRQLHNHRVALGWSAKKLSELYAEFVGREDSPPSTAFIYQVEKGTTMLDKERRAILAGLVGMPLALVSMAQQDTSTHIDISEYTNTLEKYCEGWKSSVLVNTTPVGVKTDVSRRIDNLQRASFLAFGEEKTTLVELHIGYLFLLADLKDGNPDPMTIAIDIAEAENIASRLAYSLTQRAGYWTERYLTTKNAFFASRAIDDYTRAEQEKRQLAPVHFGHVQIRKGVLDAYTARDKEEFNTALKMIDSGAKQIGVASDDKLIVAKLDEERYMLNRTFAHLYSPMGSPALGLSVLEELERKFPKPGGKSRLVTRNRLFAMAYLLIGDYPMAVAYLEAGLDVSRGVELDRLIEVHMLLKNTSYWNHPDVGRIAVKMNQIKYPKLFR